MRLRPCFTALVSLTPMLLVGAGALFGVHGGGLLARTASATATPPSLDTGVRLSRIGDARWVVGPRPGAATGLGHPVVVAGTGAQPTEITFGDEFGQGVPKAVYTGVLTPVQITLPGLVQGVVRLQGQATSLGGYVAVGDEVHFLDAAGRFSFPWGGGPADVWIKAPGHLPVVIPQANVAAGTVLTIPELTLPFGDANGDGRIDVLDLSMAAANFGDVTKPMPLPP